MYAEIIHGSGALQGGCTVTINGTGHMQKNIMPFGVPCSAIHFSWEGGFASRMHDYYKWYLLYAKNVSKITLKNKVDLLCFLDRIAVQ